MSCRSKRTVFPFLLSSGLAIGLFGACDGVDQGPGPLPPITPVETSQFALRALPTCTDVKSTVHRRAIEEMNRQLDQALESALQSASMPCRYYYEDAFMGPTSAMPSPQASVAAGAGVGVADAGSSAKQVSGTNNQVAGVDEADFVKNDGKYLYVLTDESLRIIEAWPPTEAREIAKVPVTGSARKLFVHNDRALVYSSVPRGLQASGGDEPFSAMMYRGQRSECTYGYNCQFTGDGNPTKISVFDLSDRSVPRLVREVHLSGSFLNARRVGSAVFTVVTTPGPRFDRLRYWPDLLNTCDQSHSRDEIVAAFERLRRLNTLEIRGQAVSEILPVLRDSRNDGGDLMADCRGFFRSAVGTGTQLTTLLSLEIDDESSPQATTIISRPGAIYASAEALYMSVPHQRHQGGAVGGVARGGVWFDDLPELQEASTVHKFTLDAERARAAYAASGLVKGHVLNQFAMDEHDGHLRIATTNGRVPDPKVHSTVTVLREHGQRLDTIGLLDELAPKEDIRSVRFDGERAFIVTFKKTDPLFVIDLARPSDPRVRGELKIPGFSTYMHMMDADHLLTIGYDADDQGSFAWFTGVLLQIFDVSDPEDPQLAHREVIGTRGSSSEALTNHLAFTYFAPKRVLSLPMTICEGSGGGGSYGYDMTFSGLMVYEVTATEGFRLRGRVSHPSGPDASCHNWWTDASSQVKRSIIMDDYVVSIARERIKINHLDRLGTDLRDIPLAN